MEKQGSSILSSYAAWIAGGFVLGAAFTAVDILVNNYIRAGVLPERVASYTTILPIILCGAPYYFEPTARWRRLLGTFRPFAGGAISRYMLCVAIVVAIIVGSALPRNMFGQPPWPPVASLPWLPVVAGGLWLIVTPWRRYFGHIREKPASNSNG